MSNLAIRVEGIGKRYRLGETGSTQLYKTFREELTRALTSPFHQWRLGQPSSDGDRQGYIWALKDVTFEIKRGEVVGIIGRNGAGKSTLLKILSRITEPSKGYAEIYGRVGSLLEVGTGFHPELTGRENIYLSGAIMGMKKSEIDEKRDDIISFAEIEKFIDTPVKRYSSGMFVRLAFAVAAHLEPEILLVDEVLAVGDAIFQKKCLGKMSEVSREGRTVLFVSHNMQAVRQLCNRAILLQSGTKTVDDETSKTIEYYLQDGNRQISGSKNLKEIIENLPPDPIFKLEGINLMQNGHTVTQFVENGKPLEIEIHYRVFQKTTGLRIYFDLCDDQDLLIFRSFHDEDNDGIPTMDVGYYASKAVIPADFLAPMKYELKIFSTIFNVRVFSPSGIIIPLYVERTGRANRAYMSEPIRGKIAPVICWKTDRI